MSNRHRWREYAKALDASGKRGDAFSCRAFRRIVDGCTSVVPLEYRPMFLTTDGPMLAYCGWDIAEPTIVVYGATK